MFNKLFKQVLEQCIAKRMLTGKRQAIDSVFVKANASLGSIKEKKIIKDAEACTDEMHKRMSDGYGKQMMVIRKSTVEPVIGTLVEYLGMQQVRTIGITLANKCMIMEGIAHNVRKLIKYERNRL